MRVPRFLSTYQTRVARRVLLLFIVGAIVPITVLAVVSYRQVTRQLDSQARERVRQSSKMVGFAVVERMQFLAQDLEAVARDVERAADVREAGDGVRERFPAVLFIPAGGAPVVVTGPRFTPPELDPTAREHVASGGTALAVDTAGDGPTRLFLARAIRGGREGLLWGELNGPLVWLGNAASASVPPNADMCVFGAAGEDLFCTRPAASAGLSRAARNSAGQESVFSWQDDAGEEGIAARWVIFLRFEFATEPWTVILSESRASALAALADFRLIFPLMLLLTLWVVLLLANVQIRRNLEPLRALQEHTVRIAQGDFRTKARVKSGDEFEELASSFNRMSDRLGRQFAALSALHEVDRIVLGAPGVDAVAGAVATGTRNALGREEVAVLVGQVSPEGRGLTVTAHTPAGPARAGNGTLSGLLEAGVPGTPGELDGAQAAEAAQYLWPAVVDHLTVVAARSDGAWRAALVVGTRAGRELTRDDLWDAQGFADQLAVALTNARLIDDLDAMSWESVRALARAIDAKSRWTAGHSERVTKLALRVARNLELDPDTTQILHRGGLLHDVGKIGVPGELLDKPGPLTLEERDVMRSHVTIGYDILHPIASYAQVLPIVRSHHERWDGDGYPDRLAGTDIPWLARVLAVPDVFDALVSDRPYRAGWSEGDATQYILDNAGTAFDPEVVEAFAAIPRSGESPAEARL